MVRVAAFTRPDGPFDLLRQASVRGQVIPADDDVKARPPTRDRRREVDDGDAEDAAGAAGS
jgi:hypothetical protein